MKTLFSGGTSNLLSQTQEVPFSGNLYGGGFQGLSLANTNCVAGVPLPQHQSCSSANPSRKLNSRDVQSLPVTNQDFPDQFLQRSNQSPGLHFPTSDIIGYDVRTENFNRINPNAINNNQNVNQNQSSYSNNRLFNGITTLSLEDSGALNNQVPPGNRANNYWDNFRR